MACCCGAFCTTRHYDNLGAEQWQAPGDDPESTTRLDVAVDSSNNTYNVFGVVEKINSAGTRVWASTADGRFGQQTLTTISVEADGETAYVGTRNIGSGNKNVYKLDSTDDATNGRGKVLASALIGSGDVEVKDSALDGAGGVYFATSQGVYHLDATFATPTLFGCAVNTEAIAVDGSGNVWAVGTPAIGQDCGTVDGCPIPNPGGQDGWTVRKYNSSGTLLDGHVFRSPSAVAWYNGFVYLGFREAADSSPCNVVKFDDTTFECEWSTRLGPSTETTPGIFGITFPRDIGVNANGVYAIVNEYLFQLADADGSLNWCRKNEGTRPDTTKKFGQLRALTLASNKVWVAGGATPCNDDEEDACSSGSCTNNACACTCGEIGRRGGTLVKGCDCDEVPCTFSVPVTSDCASIDGEEINWSRDLADNDIQTWHGVLTFTCDGDTVAVVFVATNDCSQEATGGWTLTATISEGYTISTEILDWWCTDDAPAGQTFPGFSGTFTIGGLGDCCDAEVTSCLAFGEAAGACGVDLCGCTGIPETLSYSVTGCYTASGTLTFNGTDTWADTTGFDCGGVGNLLPLIRCNAGSWEGEIGRQAIIGLIPCTWLDTAPSVTCSPFELIATGSASSGCPCCGGGGSVTLTVTG